MLSGYEYILTKQIQWANNRNIPCLNLPRLLTPLSLLVLIVVFGALKV